MDPNRIKRLHQEELKIKEDIDTLKRYIRQYKAELGHPNTSTLRATRDNWMSENEQNAEKGRNETIWNEAKRLVGNTLSFKNKAKLLIGLTPAEVGKVDYLKIKEWAETRSAERSAQRKKNERYALRTKQAEKALNTKGGRRLTRSKRRAASTRRKSRQ